MHLNTYIRGGYKSLRLSNQRIDYWILSLPKYLIDDLENILKIRKFNNRSRLDLKLKRKVQSYTFNYQSSNENFAA